MNMGAFSGEEGWFLSTW